VTTVRTLTGYAVAVGFPFGAILFVAAFTTGADPWRDMVRPAAVWCGHQIT
jgi:hypothetical protein